MFGTVEDFIKIIDLDKFADKTANAEVIVEVAKIVVKGFDQFKPLLMDIFEGLTEEEVQRIKVKEVVPVLINVAKYSFSEILNTSNEKNA